MKWNIGKILSKWELVIPDKTAIILQIGLRIFFKKKG